MKRGFISVFLFMAASLVISLSISWFICDMKIGRMKDAAVDAERTLQRERLEKILTAVNSWRHEIEKQANVLSSAENIRIYAQDSSSFSGTDMNDRAGISREERDLIRQGEYLARRFNDLSRQGMFDGAALFYPNGTVMLPGPKILALNLADRTMELIRNAGRKGEPAFDRMRWENGRLFMLYVVPILSGEEDAKPLGSLVLDINMDRAFKKFISLGNAGDLSSFIFVLGRENMAAIGMKGSELAITRVAGDSFPDFTFGLRQSPVSSAEVYSIGGKAADLDWEVFIEERATAISARIRDQEIGILAAGAGLAVAASIFLTFLWAFWNARSHAAHAAETKKLYDIASSQKFMLDSINASLKAGIILADKRGRIIVSNPAFAEMMGLSEVEEGQSLAELYDGASGPALMSAMNRAANAKRDDVLEMAAGGRLYRISLFPYAAGPNSIIDGGCVAVFTDITEFRKNAKLAAERRMSVTAALVRAIESVDPLLNGHSQKMLALAERFAKRLDLQSGDAEALKLASLLSQIGKIFVPRELFAKKDALSDSDMALLRQIPAYSDRFLAELDLDLPVRDLVSQMWRISNGALDPGEAPLLAQILSLLNVFTALTSDRSWRKRMEDGEAIEFLRGQNLFPENLIDVLGKE